MARKALEDLRECRDFQSFTDIWYTFLVAAKNVYTALEKGAKLSPQSRQWFGARKQERKDDELLQYMFQARDDDEHGLGQVAKQAPGYTAVGVKKPGFSTDITFSFRDGVVTQLESNDGKPVAIETRGPHAKLIPVQGRNRAYDPPTQHRGAPIDGTEPYPCGKLTLAYLEELVADAEKLA